MLADKRVERPKRKHGNIPAIKDEYDQPKRISSCRRIASFVPATALAAAASPAAGPTGRTDPDARFRHGGVRRDPRGRRAAPSISSRATKLDGGDRFSQQMCNSHRTPTTTSASQRTSARRSGAVSRSGDRARAVTTRCGTNYFIPCDAVLRNTSESQRFRSSRSPAAEIRICTQATGGRDDSSIETLVAPRVRTSSCATTPLAGFAQFVATAFMKRPARRRTPRWRDIWSPRRYARAGRRLGGACSPGAQLYAPAGDALVHLGGRRSRRRWYGKQRETSRRKERRSSRASRIVGRSRPESRGKCTRTEPGSHSPIRANASATK